MTRTSLVILAAGIGSRYGGTKQLDEVTSNGYTIIDFSIYDAILSGFSKIVFIVREQISEEFKKVFDEKLKNKNVEVLYVNQEVDSIPNEFLPTARTKPWGTGQALLSAKDFVKENFCVINADDFYGREAFAEMYQHLQRVNVQSNEFVMVGYQLKNTLSESGSVSRGQCFVDENSNLEKIIERTDIYRKGENIVYMDDENSEIKISSDTITSMNFWGFTPVVFEFLETTFHKFLSENHSSQKDEFFLPMVINDLVVEKKANVKVLQSQEKWVGVTYKEDKIEVCKKIKNLQKKGIYPDKLW